MIIGDALNVSRQASAAGKHQQDRRWHGQRHHDLHVPEGSSQSGGGGWRLLSLDLPECWEDLDATSLAQCVKADGQERREFVGREARRAGLPYEQLWGDSRSFDYSALGRVDVWWIDGAHDYRHVRHEALSAARQGARLILFHDADLPDVLQAAVDALTSPTTSDTDAATLHQSSSSSSLPPVSRSSPSTSSFPVSDYSVHYVFDTRIAYALRRS
jgi:hypothetical protein